MQFTALLNQCVTVDAQNGVDERHRLDRRDRTFGLHRHAAFDLRLLHDRKPGRLGEIIQHGIGTGFLEIQADRSGFAIGRLRGGGNVDRGFGLRGRRIGLARRLTRRLALGLAIGRHGRSIGPHDHFLRLCLRPHCQHEDADSEHQERFQSKFATLDAHFSLECMNFTPTFVRFANLHQIPFNANLGL